MNNAEIFFGCVVISGLFVFGVIAINEGMQGVGNSRRFNQPFTMFLFAMLTWAIGLWCIFYIFKNIRGF